MEDVGADGGDDHEEDHNFSLTQPDDLDLSVDTDRRIDNLTMKSNESLEACHQRFKDLLNDYKNHIDPAQNDLNNDSCNR